MGTMKKRAKRVSSEDFVTAWMESKSIAEVSEKTGLSRTSATQRASNMRRRYGLKLPYHTRRGNHVDVDHLSGLIDSYKNDEEHTDA